MQEKGYEKFKKIYHQRKNSLISEQILATNSLQKKYTKITMENLYVDIGTSKLKSRSVLFSEFRDVNLSRSCLPVAMAEEM